jgi:hypothetical protein
MPWYLAGGIIALVGPTLMHTVKLETSTARVYGYSIILAFGTGMFSQASFPVAQANAKPNEVPLATAFIGCTLVLLLHAKGQ